MPLSFASYWYVVATSDELGSAPLARQVLDEWLVVFRDEAGVARVLQDRCRLKCARLRPRGKHQ